MTRIEKIKLIANYYDTSLQGARWMVQQGFVNGAYAVKRGSKHTYRFEPELIKKLEESKCKMNAE